MRYCPITKTECQICSSLEQQWKLENIFTKLEEVKGKINYLDSPSNLITRDSALIKKKPLTEKEKCVFKLILSDLSIKEIASHLNFSYNSLRNWLSKNLYIYLKILAQDLHFTFPNDKFKHYHLKELLERNNYRKDSSLLSINKKTENLSHLNIVFNYMGFEKSENGDLKPKLTISFNVDAEFFNSDMVEYIINIIHQISEDKRWIILPNDISLDKKIIRTFPPLQIQQFLIKGCGFSQP